MKTKTWKLEGAALCVAVALAKGIPLEDIKLPRYKSDGPWTWLRDDDGNLTNSYMTGPDLLFDRKWEAAGPIIEKNRICIEIGHDGVWLAYTMQNYDDNKEYMQAGPTPLIAAMRCYVTSKLGDEVELPEGL